MGLTHQVVMLTHLTGLLDRGHSPFVQGFVGIFLYPGSSMLLGAVVMLKLFSTHQRSQCVNIFDFSCIACEVHTL